MMQMLSFSFNGIRKDYVHMLQGRKRPPWPTLARNILTVPGRPGGHLQGTEIQPRIIEVPIVIEGKNIGDLQKLKEDLASWLVTDEPKELVFDDEPDRTYYAVVDETIDFDEIAYLGQGTVRFLCPDPYKYGPLRTQTIAVPPASFSRNSVAYLSDGTQVSANQPRFENGGVLIEEGTTNLLTRPIAFENWAKTKVLITPNATTAPDGSNSAYMLQRTDTTNNYLQHQSISKSASAVTYTASIYVKKGSGSYFALRMQGVYPARADVCFNLDTGTISLNPTVFSGFSNASATIMPIKDGWYRVSLTATTDSGSSVVVFISPRNTSGVIDQNDTSPDSYVYVWRAQLEQKPYATSFVDGTRQPETLTLPTDGVLNNDAFTIEMWIKCSIVTTSAFTHNGTFLNLGNGLRIWNYSPAWPDPNRGDSNARRLIVEFGSDDSGNRQFLDLISSTRFSTTEFEHFAVTFDGTKFKFYRNGSKWSEKQPTKINLLSKIAFEASGWFIGPFRISRIARSDAEILDAYQNGFKVDEYTTAYLPFDGSLEVQTPTIVNNEGTAETYPTFTAYVKQPITFLDIIAPDAYMRVGQPYEVSQTPVDGDKPVMQDKMTTTTGWGAATSVVDGIVQGTMVSDGERFVVQSYGPTYNGWAGPALKKSLPYPIEDFRMYSLVQIHANEKGTGRVEIYGLDTTNNIVFRATIADFWQNTRMVRLQCELGTSRDMAWMTYGKKKGDLNYYYGAINIRRKGNLWEFYTARVNNEGNLVDFVRHTFTDTKNKYTAPLAQLQVHIGCHMSYGPVDHMSINHLYVYELRDHQENEVPYIAYTDDVLQFDHKNAVIYRNGEPIMWAKDFGASFFALKPGATELAVNPSDAAVVTIDYRPRYK